MTNIVITVAAYLIFGGFAVHDHCKQEFWIFLYYFLGWPAVIFKNLASVLMINRWKICVKCEKHNKPDARFCRWCGAAYTYLNEKEKKTDGCKVAWPKPTGGHNPSATVAKPKIDNVGQNSGNRSGPAFGYITASAMLFIDVGRKFRYGSDDYTIKSRHWNWEPYITATDSKGVDRLFYTKDKYTFTQEEFLGVPKKELIEEYLPTTAGYLLNEKKPKYVMTDELKIGDHFVHTGVSYEVMQVPQLGCIIADSGYRKNVSFGNVTVFKYYPYTEEVQLGKMLPEDHFVFGFDVHKIIRHNFDTKRTTVVTITNSSPIEFELDSDLRGSLLPDYSVSDKNREIKTLKVDDIIEFKNKRGRINATVEVLEMHGRKDIPSWEKITGLAGNTRVKLVKPLPAQAFPIEF